jgi:hypothetical protein
VQAFKEEGKTDDAAKASSIRHFAVLKHYETTAIDKAVERSLEAIGTRTLWIAFPKFRTGSVRCTRRAAGSGPRYTNPNLN